MNREQIVTIFLLLATVAFFFLAAGLLLPYAAPVGWAVVLAMVFHPAYRALRGLMPRYPNLAAGIMTMLVFSVVVVPSLLLTSILAREAVEGYVHLKAFLGAAPFQELQDRVTQHWLVAPVWNWFRDQQQSGDVKPLSLLQSGAGSVAQYLASQASAVAVNVFSFLVGIGIMLFTLFFAFRDGAALIGSAEEVLPMAADDRRLIITRLQQTTLAVVQGLTLTAALQGVLVSVGLWAVGIEFAMLLGTATFFLAFLPVGGASLVWIPTAAGLLISGAWVRGILFGVYSMLVVSSVDNFVRPVVIGSQAQISTPILFFGILGGLQAYGFIGLFFGPAILATFSVLIGIYRERFLAEKSVVVTPGNAPLSDPQRSDHRS